MQHNIFKLGCHLHTGGKGVGWGVGGEGWGVEGFGGIVKLSSLSLGFSIWCSRNLGSHPGVLEIRGVK